MAGPLGQGAPVRARPRGAPARRGARVRPARRTALRHRRHPLRDGDEQGVEGHRGPVAASDGQARRVSAGLGLPRPADRTAGREEPGQGRPGPGRGRVPAALRRARDEVRRRHAHGVQAARLPRPLGRPVPDAGQGLRGDDRAPAGRLRRQGPGLPRQEARALVLRPPHGAGRGGGRVRGARLTVDLRALPDRRRHRQGRAAPARPARRVRHLDDDPLDAAREPGRRRQSGAGLRRDPARRGIPDRGGRPRRIVPGGDGHRRAPGDVDPDPA